MFFDFKKKLIKAYWKNKKWSKIYITLQKKKEKLKKRKFYQFSIKNKLIYYEDLINL